MNSAADSAPKAAFGPGTIAALALLAVVAAFLYALSWNSRSAGFLSDDAVYLLMADGFNPFRPAEPALIAYVMRHSLFPPFYPLVLGVLGAGSGSLLWAHVITTTTLVLALAAYGCWVLSLTRDRVAALGLVLIVALSPGVLFENLEILSEFPYLLLSLLALWLAGRSSDTHRGYGWIAVCVALATLTRSAGLSLILAMAVWLLGNRVRGTVKWLAVALVPSVVWVVYKTWVLGNHGGYEGLWLWLWGQFEHHQGHVPRFVENQGASLWQGFLTNLDLRPTRLTEIVAGLTLLAGIPVWIRRLRAWQLDAWYLLIGGAMLLLYPFPEFSTRLTLPWMPVILLYAFLGVSAATRGWGEVGGRPALARACLAVLFLTLVPSLGFVLHRLAQPVDPALAHWKHTRYWFRFESMHKVKAELRFRENLIRAARDVGREVPAADCVYGVYAGLTMLYGRRIVQLPPAPNVSDAEFEKQSRACRYFFLMPVKARIGGRPVGAYYPYSRLPPGRTEIVHVWNDPSDPKAPTAMLLRERGAR